MNFDPLFLTIAIFALLAACLLKAAKVKRQRRFERERDEAIARAKARQAIAGLPIGKQRAAEQAWRSSL